ncbi:MAG TPA: hypothetical protein DCS39_00710 [Rhodobiaceae bacterium]|nr:hypothetical protein [Rhodobiaceae bacterium]
MSESCQFIKLDKLFSVLDAAMTQEAIWIVVDYFVRDGVAGVMSKSGHTYTIFQRAVTKSQLTMDYDRDITEAVLPTLDFAADLVTRGELALSMLRQRINQRSVVLSKIVDVILWMARKELTKLQQSRILIDSDAFKEAKTYRLMRFVRS